MTKTILVTGGAGYIGSHTCVALLEADYQLVVVDNLVNSKREALRRVERLAGKNVAFASVDIRDKTALSEVFAEYKPDAVIHFAGLKAVGESAEKPLTYYDNNVYGTLVLSEVMEQHHCTRLVFSSSATVYGEGAPIPYIEHLPTGASNVYGRTKWMVEEVLKDVCAKPNSPWQVSLLRYFNPIGAHPSGDIGEDPNGIPNNLLPFVAQVAVGKRERLRVFGNDYPTRDGTGVRDYIHVMDLARGHVCAVDALFKPESEKGWDAFNLGAGKGYSVLEVVQAFEAASGKTIPYDILPRRPGDLPEFYADATKAKERLNWEVSYDLPSMVADTWRWQSQNPEGYPED